MNRWFVRFIVYIVLVVAIHYLALAFIIGGQLPEGWTTKSKLYILGSFLVSFLILSALIYALLRKMLAPIGEVTQFISDLSKGYYWRRLYSEGAKGELSELIERTNDLAKQLQQSTEKEHLSENRLKAIIKHMVSGLLFISQQGKIVLSNQRALDLLQWEEVDRELLYYQAPLPLEIIELIQEAFTYEQERNKQVTIKRGLSQLDIDLSVTPVKDDQGRLKGIILVLHDITELKKLERMRQDFVANVSHELKTPLTSIKGFAETLLHGAMHSEKHLVQFLEIIHKESERLDRLIRDLLDLADIEQKRLELKWQDVDLIQLAKENILLLKPQAEKKEISLRLVHVGQEGKASSKAIVRGDRDRLSQILVNLLSNALQYTPKNGKVEVKIEPWEEKGYKLSVIDTGVGIKQGELTRIFERFYRVDKARSRASGGTGLGLAIVKHLVEAHQGQLQVTSKEGEGSTFSVFLYS